MNSENSLSGKSTASCDLSKKSSNETVYSHKIQNPEIEEINLPEFLDFLNVSCHVNEMISNSENERNDLKTSAIKKKSNVNFKKLANNRLINDLYGYKKASSTTNTPPEMDDLFTDQVKNIRTPTIADTLQRNRSGSSNFIQTFQTLKKQDPLQNPVSGTELHQKLKNKLDFVINEGVLDSVLPFVCPVQAPANMLHRNKIKTKDSSQHNKKEGNNNVAVDADIKSCGITESEKETPIAATVDTPLNMVKLKEQRSLNRNSKSQNFTRSQNVSITGSDEQREPEVIIHVCDEVKNCSKDFSCPQNLLVSKMGYFADVTAGQKLDDMDISVHCDIHIFDWLMRWVKHTVNGNDNLQHNSNTTVTTTGNIDAGPQLDASNVVPILVSASFLQMEPLFADCLSFCHARLSEIVRVSTNLSCLNESIITCLAAMFTNTELEMVRDKKERVTPRLWTKLIQSLCEPEPEALRGHFYSLAGLFRCSKCDKCLTNTMKSYISCLPSNVRLNRWGQVVNHHVRDPNWDINTYIAQLFKEQKSWRKVYWKLWGHCHFLYCCTCETHFPVYQMSWCRYHPEVPNFLGPVTEGRMAGPTGRYPCCGQQAFRYETMPGPNGCLFREHSVLVETDRERAILNIVQLVSEGHALCEAPPLKLQETVNNRTDTEPRWAGLSLMPQRCRQGLLPVLNPDESVARIARRVRGGASKYFAESSSDSDTSDTLEDLPTSHQAKKRPLHNSICQSFSTSSDGCESDFSDIKATNTKKGTRKRQTDIPGRNWSGELSARSNQDNQREFEEKVMKQVIAIVSKKIGSEYIASQNLVPIGGTYVRLESEWREQIKQRNNNTIPNNCGGNNQQHISSVSSSTTSNGNKQKNK